MDGQGVGSSRPEDRADAIRHFDERVDAAMRLSPPTKGWVTSAMRRGGAPRCPVRLRRLSYEVILRYGDALADLFVDNPDDVIFVEPYDFFVGHQTMDGDDTLDPVQLVTGAGRWTDEWGTGWEHADGGVAASTVSHPLEDWAALDRYMVEAFPDPHADGRLLGAMKTLDELGPAQYTVGVIYMALFERFHSLRGMENAFEDLYLHPGETERLLDALTAYSVEVIRAWGQHPSVDAVYLTDDWGTQTAMMISPDMWRRYFAPRYQRLADAAHGQGLDVIFHSCGRVTQIIGDLIDLGVDVIDPVQPEVVDLRWLAGEFGGRVAFSGGLSNQGLARSSPAQVRDQVRQAIDVLGSGFGNAYLLSPSNTLLPDVPMANIEALFEVCHNQ